LLGDLFEREAVAVERGLLVAQRLPALDRHVRVLRIQFHAAADALGEFRGGKAGTLSSPRLVWFRIGRRINSMGFWVGWSNFSLSEPPMMNFGEGESQMVEFSPALPNHGAFFFRTYQHGSC
jgi:hypothetical protein